METTTVVINMDNESLREAMIQLIKYIVMEPPSPDEFEQSEMIAYNSGIRVLFDCLQSTF